MQELQEKNKELDDNLAKEIKKSSTLTGKYELLEEEHVLFKAQLTTEKEKLDNEIKSLKSKVNQFDDADAASRREKADLNKKVTDLQRKLTEAEHNNSKVTTSTFELDRSRLKAKLEEKESEFNKLSKQNEMNLDQLSTMRKEVSFLSCVLEKSELIFDQFQYEDIRRKLDDFERINRAQRTLNDHNQTLENELKKLRVK